MAHHIFIQGPLGSGKTFLMSLLATHWRDKVIAAGGDIKLYSNYGLKNSAPLDDYEAWYDVAAAQGSIVCWDEAQMAFSNRKWSKYGAGVATELLMYTRKMQSVQFYCSPSIQNVDSRIRQIVEILIDVRKIGKSGFSLRFTDYQTGEFMHKQFIPTSKANRIFKLGLYDTHERVMGFPLPQNERDGKTFFETLQKIHNANRKFKGATTNDAINVQSDKSKV